MKRSNKRIRNIGFVTIIIISLILMYVGVLYTKTSNIVIREDKAAVGDGIRLVEYTSPYSSTSVDKISPRTDNSTVGWCIQKGGYLDGRVATIREISNGYGNSNPASGNSNQLDWLYVNMARFGEGVPAEEITYYKANLQSIVNKHGGGDISSYSNDDIFAIEQFVIWHYTQNINQPVYPTSNILYTSLIAEADANADYTHKDSSVSITKDNAELGEGYVGPFKAAIVGNVTLTSNLGKIYKNSACTEEYTGGDYTGDLYLSVNSSDTSVNATISWNYYNTAVTRYDTQGSYSDLSQNQAFVTINRTKSSSSISFEDEIIIQGSFDIELVKYEKDKEIKLSGAEFNVEISDLGYTDTKTTGNDGIASFNPAKIEEEGKYHVKVTEKKAPAGYIGLAKPIEFDVNTVLDGDTYKLVADHSIKLDNARKVDIDEGKILIEAENRTTSIDIHKGVKTVENQDSGYYSVAEKIKEAEDKQAKEDAERGTEYEDENTGKKYTEIELEDMQHEWVVETTIPEGISNYKRYLVNDPIDTTKLNFSGLDRVKVELIDSTGKVVKTLEKDKDYTTKYENDILTVIYIDKKDGNDFYGEFLSEATTSNKVRLTFNTTFKVNPETGKLVVLEGTITNAENQAKLKYDNGSGTDQDDESETPEVHTGAVSVFKYEDTNNNGKHDEGEKALVGAEFKIALSEEDAKNGKFIKLDGEELVAVSNEHGIATFIGLEFGGDASDSQKSNPEGLYEYDWDKASKDYYIVETKSPGGYKKLDEVIKVTVSKDSSEIIDLTDKINEMESVGNLPLKFDLALRKWVTHAIVTENGQSVVYETGHHAEDDPEAIVKVDLKKSKLNQVKVQFKYSIRVTNEGEIAGEAREVTDYIPEGLKFVQEDNPNWTTTSDERVVKTRLLEGVTLQPGESAEVEILLTWVNSESSMGVMVNTAEISEDYNEFGVHDIDSTPNNKKAGEDDIDDAPVMLAIKTGSETIGYVTLGIGFASIITLGAVEIKKRIL